MTPSANIRYITTETMMSLMVKHTTIQVSVCVFFSSLKLKIEISYTFARNVHVLSLFFLQLSVKQLNFSHMWNKH